MKLIPYRLLLALLVALSLTACGSDSDEIPHNDDEVDVTESDGPGGKSDTLDDVIEDEADGDGEEDATDAAGDDDALVDSSNGDADDEPEIPSQITTEGAEFEGVIPPNGSLDVTLNVNVGDTVVMRLSAEGAPEWNPSIDLYEMGEADPLVYSNAENGEDAHIPYHEDDLQDGFEFYDGVAHRIELSNQSGVEGNFKFTLECLAGSCLGDENGGGDENNAPGDENNDPGDGPYAGLSDNELKDALKATYSTFTDLGYGPARDFMFDYDRDNVGEQDEIECIYSGRTSFVDGRMDAQNQTPMWNTEHTWPQSKGAKGAAKSDLHHLFVIDANINQKRGNHDFGTVVGNIQYSEGGSVLGDNAAGQTRFQVRDETKGNVARAIFYFAVIYSGKPGVADLPADSVETLREWHVDDPVDDAERARNDAVEGAQGNRNFFIDHPELVDRIDDYNR